MSIIWKYLDKRSATVAAIKDYSSMEFIINHTDEEIMAERLKAEGVGSPNWDGMPHTHRYRQAVEYMEWFRPAWEELSEDEQYVLETFYQDDDQGGAVYEICDAYKIERSTAYNKKNKALSHLQTLLFGKN